MSLQPGTTLGPYNVTAEISAGGMGEVYRARDTKLDHPRVLECRDVGSDLRSATKVQARPDVFCEIIRGSTEQFAD